MLCAYSTLLGFSLLSYIAYMWNAHFICSTSLVCAATGWMAHRDSNDIYWNSLDVWMVQSIAVANYVATFYLM